MIIGVDSNGLIRNNIRKACNGYYLRWYYNGWHYWFFQPGTNTILTVGEKYRTIGTRKVAMSTGQVTRAECNALRTIMNTREVYLFSVDGWMNIRIEPGSINVYDHQINGEEFEFVAFIGNKAITKTSGFSPIVVIPVVPPTTTYCNIDIAISLQTWMCKNFESNYPGSKVYFNDETNRSEFGGLYNWNMIHAPGFCPVGYHVPTKAEWQTLIDAIGTLADAGGLLKEVGGSHWNAPNTGATDTYSFTWVGAGFCGTPGNIFSGRYEFSYLVCQDEYSATEFNLVKVNHDNAAISFEHAPKHFLFPVRLIKDIPIAFAQIKYGRLYNRYVELDVRNVCNTGWHVPSFAEWNILNTLLGGSSVAGGKLKETGTTHWVAPNTGATNETGFNLRPSGAREGANGLFYKIGTGCELSELDWGWTRWAGNTAATFNRHGLSDKSGRSIRPLKDSTTLVDGQTGIYVGNDGKLYPTICIGTQEWVACNIAETKFRNGDLITVVTDNNAWKVLITEAMCYYNNDPTNE